ncbi:DUF421 domain-containing protein [Deinococcus sp. Marseille-Q6407]|uniref:DUF421 domain-containing protein n=1 Tax=Deinococcus sp. Marseille-Q6407 TaxID=2969223 RepID=UPI0021BE0C40|nr:hypothetical protein [Deinococcus sp. Marseille-Q6407]
MQPFDWQRMFLKDITPLFMLEIVFRTAVIFLWLIFLLRLSGQRSVAQLGPLELALVIGMGSAAGDPMFYPEVPLLHAMLALALVVGMQQLIMRLAVHNETAETLLEGQPLEMVRDGVLNLASIQHFQARAGPGPARPTGDAALGLGATPAAAGVSGPTGLPQLRHASHSWTSLSLWEPGHCTCCD